MTHFEQLAAFLTLSVALPLAYGQGGKDTGIPDGFLNSSGVLQTIGASGTLDLTGPFFQSFGTNGRSCGSCHRPAQAWTISAGEVKQRFDATEGLDPIFSPNDGSVCDHDIDTSTLGGRRRAYRLLLRRALIRVTMDVPASAEFTVAGVENPYGCSDTATLSLYRRPLPATNLRFLSTVMWDGRESSVETMTQNITLATNPGDLKADLAHQALGATNGHAQAATPLPVAQQNAIVDFELGLATAQAYDFRAGLLNAGGANGGPAYVAQKVAPAFLIGSNDPFVAGFTPSIFNLYDAWTDAQPDGAVDAEQAAARARIARGQELFNSKPIRITGVAGLNDALNQESIDGTCGTCHDSLNAGNHSLAVPLNIGVGDLGGPLDLSYLPVITLRNKKTGEIRVTTDPGRAMVTGLWKDIGRLKGPVLRGLAARAPYFHNGSARTLKDVVDFYQKRFDIGFTAREKQDLVAFLSAL